MRTLTLIFLLIISTEGCRSQPSSAAEEMERWSCFELKEQDINLYADSLNFWVKGMPFPNFIVDPKFDQKFIYSNVCLRTNWIFSHRKLIIDRVSNIDALNSIIKSNDKRLDQTYVLNEEEADKVEDFIVDFPYATHSTRYLVKSRMDRINEIKEFLGVK
jgi:hypothetical protein